MAKGPIEVDKRWGDWRKIYQVWLTGKRINRVSDRAECILLRLHLICDDYGNHYAAPELLNDKLAPRKPWTAAQIVACLNELEGAKLIKRYKNGGEECLRILGYTHMQSPPNGRMVARYPPDPGMKRPKVIQGNQRKPVLSDSDSDSDSETELTPQTPLAGGPSSRKRGGPMGASQ